MCAAMEDSYSIEQQLGCMPLTPSWSQSQLPLPGDAFCGQPVAGQQIAMVDLGHVQAILAAKERQTELLAQTLVHMQAELQQTKDERDAARLDANRCKEIHAAQTIFLCRHWGNHPTWTTADAHLEMRNFVFQSMAQRSKANEIAKEFEARNKISH